MDNLISQISNLFIRGIVLSCSMDLANCNLSNGQEAEQLLKSMFRLRIHQVNELGPNPGSEEVEIFRQKTCGFHFLLREDFKKVDLFANSENNVRNVGNVGNDVRNRLEHNFTFYPDQYDKWTLFFQQDLEKAVQILKLRTLPTCECLSEEFIYDPSCSLPLDVYAEVPAYFQVMYNRIVALFSVYWKERESQDPIKNRTALDDAIEMIEQNSLLHYYNEVKNTNYVEEFKKETGREPNIYDNWAGKLSIQGLVPDKGTTPKPDDDGYL